MTSKKRVVPGTILGSTNEYQAGEGVYSFDGLLYASLVGEMVIEQLNNQGEGDNYLKAAPLNRLNIVRNKIIAKDTVLLVGDFVVCQVVKILVNMVIVEVLLVGDIELKNPIKAIIRREDMKMSEVDKIVVSEAFHVGDLVKAVVISFGDSKQYFLSCANDVLGVCVARNEMNGKLMVSINEEEIMDPTSSNREKRKAAKPSPVSS